MPGADRRIRLKMFKIQETMKCVVTTNFIDCDPGTDS